MLGGSCSCSTVSCSPLACPLPKLWDWGGGERRVSCWRGQGSHLTLGGTKTEVVTHQTRLGHAALYPALWDICDSLFVVLDSMYNYIYHLSAPGFVDIARISFSLLLHCQPELKWPAKTLILHSFNSSFLIRTTTSWWDSARLQIHFCPL